MAARFRAGQRLRTSATAITNYAAELGFEITGSDFTKMVDKLAKGEPASEC